MKTKEKKTNMTIFRTTAIAASIFALSACGGGGGSSSDSGSPSTAPNSDVSDQVGPGVYTTEFVDGSGNVTDGFVSILSPTGKHVVAVNQADMTTGDLQFRTDKTFSGSGQRIFFSDSADDWVTRDVNINGEVGDDAESLLLIASGTDYESQAVLTRKNELSDQAISLDLISGTYLRQNVGGDNSSFTIGTDGSVTGESVLTECIFSDGQATIPDPSINVIEISFLAENCIEYQNTTAEQRNGRFIGLATYENDEGVESLTIIGDNDKVNALFVGTK